jgi:ribose/xylose/arabinose/galactoside ABC-type transport system permease subunit
MVKSGSRNTCARAEELVYAFYALVALALVSIGAEWKRSRIGLPPFIVTLVLTLICLGIGGYIAYAGGHIRHKEFRFEPAPEPSAEEPQPHEH